MPVTPLATLILATTGALSPVATVACAPSYTSDPPMLEVEPSAKDAGGEARANVAQIDGFHSGTRLHARLQVIGDVQRFIGWFDTKLNTPCRFQVAEDGALRCLPSSLSASENLFADPSCTGTPGALVPGCATDEFIRVPSRAGCGVAVYRATTATTDAFIQGPSSCTRLASATNVFVTPSGSALPPASFVRGELASTPGVRLQPRTVIAEDGAAEVVSAWDSALETACDATPLADGICRPIADAFDRVYLDQGCTQSAFRVQKPECLQQKVGVSEDACRIRFYRLGASSQQTPVFRNNSSCSNDAVSTGVVLQANELLGFAPTELRREGTGTVGLVTPRNELGQALAPAPSFVDLRTGQRCSVRLAQDGVRRCLPERVESVTFFADAKCERPLLASSAGACVAPGDPGPRIGDLVAFPSATRDACTSIFSVVRRLEKYVPGPDRVYGRPSGICLPLASPPAVELFRTEDVAPRELSAASSDRIQGNN